MGRIMNMNRNKLVLHSETNKLNFPDHLKAAIHNYGDVTPTMLILL